MMLDDGYYGATADAFEFISRRTAFRQGTGLPGAGLGDRLAGVHGRPGQGRALPARRQRAEGGHQPRLRDPLCRGRRQPLRAWPSCRRWPRRSCGASRPGCPTLPAATCCAARASAKWPGALDVGRIDEQVGRGEGALGQAFATGVPAVSDQVRRPSRASSPCPCCAAAASPRLWPGTSEPPRRKADEEDETRDDRQRHGRRAHARGAAEDRARAVRHHRVRRRAAPQLQPHPAQPGAGRRADARRDRPQPAVLVRRERHHAACRQEGDAHRPRSSRVVHADDGTAGALRPPAAGHRLATPSSCRCRARSCRASSPTATSPTRRR